MNILTKYALIFNLFFFAFNLVVLFKKHPSNYFSTSDENQYYSKYVSRDIENFFKSKRTISDVISKFGAPTNSTNHMDKAIHVFLLPPNFTINFPEESVVGFSVLSDSNGVILSWSYSKIGAFMHID